jgi:predicted adenylyl cyclase CyaB
MVEIEVKLPVVDAKAFREALLRAGARLERERTAEENTLYDFRSGELRSKGQALRLREAGRKTFLTFKGTAQKSRRFKVRDEFETEVRNGKQMRQILKRLGLVPAFHYQKHRTVFRKGSVKVCLDETAVGVFAELEGERSDIVRLAKSLGFSPAQMIKRDYVEMIRDAGKAV